MHKKKPLVSIIVPAYNAERTIERCLHSIELQTWTNFEAIIVNDGSTDHTEKIIRKYSERDPRFHLLNRKNAGVSASRNAGMSAAHGEFFQFVDSDDWIVREAAETFVRSYLLSRADLSVCDFYRVEGPEVRIKGDISTEGYVTRRVYANEMMKAPANFYYGVMWNKFYRASIIRKHKLRFPKELDWCEDFQFNMEYLQYVNGVYVILEPMYYYVKTKGSLVDTKVNFPATVRTKRILFDYYKDLYQSLDLYEDNKLKIQTFFVEFARDKDKTARYGGEKIMNNQLTQGDIEKMEKEIEYRKLVVRKKVLESVKEARAQGDLSENFEYHAAKKEKNQNDSRIRYLERMIRTAEVITDHSGSDEIGINNTVDVYFEDDDTLETYKLVTTVRGDTLKGRISVESPIGKALLGHKVGDRVHVRVSDEVGYDVIVKRIAKTEDEGEEISEY